MITLSESYDRVSQEYTERIFGELAGKPKDRELLDRFAERIGNGGHVCDLGCGPGQVARYLASRNLTPLGVDISPGMIAEAQRLNPDLDFRVGDFLDLPLPDESFHGGVAFYSLIHVEKAQLHRAFSEIRRVLKPAGMLLFSFHIGEETIHLDEWWEQKVNLDFHFFQTKHILPIVQSSGFEIVDVTERDPYSADVEHQSRRAYFLVRKSCKLTPLNVPF